MQRGGKQFNRARTRDRRQKLTPLDLDDDCVAAPPASVVVSEPQTQPWSELAPYMADGTDYTFGVPDDVRAKFPPQTFAL